MDPDTTAKPKWYKNKKTWLIIGGVVLVLAMFGPETPTPTNTPAATQAAQQKANAAAFAAMTPQQRMDACLTRMTFYRDLGVWTVGGETPLVKRAAWRELDDDEQAEIFQIGGCLKTEGNLREVMVTIKDDAAPVLDIETRRVMVGATSGMALDKPVAAPAKP